jgi:hypothetical protein
VVKPTGFRREIIVNLFSELACRLVRSRVRISSPALRFLWKKTCTRNALLRMHFFASQRPSEKSKDFSSPAFFQNAWCTKIWGFAPCMLVFARALRVQLFWSCLIVCFCPSVASATLLELFDCMFLSERCECNSFGVA